MHRRHLPAAALGEREGRLRDPGGTRPRDLAHGEREVGRGHELAGTEEHGTVGVEALGVLAGDHKIDGSAATRRKTAAAARRTDIGKQVEALAQFPGGIEAALRDRRIIVVRYRSENDAVRRSGGLHRRLGQRGALRVQGRKPDRHRRECKAELEDAIGGAKNRHRRRGNFRPDAVAFHHDDANRR